MIQNKALKKSEIRKLKKLGIDLLKIQKALEGMTPLVGILTDDEIISIVSNCNSATDRIKKEIEKIKNKR